MIVTFVMMTTCCTPGMLDELKGYDRLNSFGVLPKQGEGCQPVQKTLQQHSANMVLATALDC